MLTLKSLWKAPPTLRIWILKTSGIHEPGLNWFTMILLVFGRRGPEKKGIFDWSVTMISPPLGLSVPLSWQVYPCGAVGQGAAVYRKINSSEQVGLQVHCGATMGSISSQGTPVAVSTHVRFVLMEHSGSLDKKNSSSSSHPSPSGGSASPIMR